MPNVRLSGLIATIIAGFITASVPLVPAAEQTPGTKPKSPDSAIEAPEAALRKFTVAPALQVDLYAAEPDVRNPVSLSIDEQGRVFVVESDRRRSSVIDIRWHKEWLDADLSFRTVPDRSNFLKREVVPGNHAVLGRLTKPGQGGFRDFNQDGILDWHDLEVQSERIRLLEDSDGDGRADRVRVFADGFTNIVAGVAAGVLARRGEVYFACIPDLWKISSSGFRVPGFEFDTPPATRNSKLETRNLISGFGVHIAFGGHDMHGLIFGPDGRLYWSIADRGTDTNLFAQIKNPIPGLTPELLADSGCIFRAYPDGSDFEVIAWGLRNPQELAFDEFGNLFTADNNGDGGDKARWHYVVEGADFGWRIGWQWLEARAYQPKMGPWNGERLWHLAESNTAAYLLPALAHIGHGPAGLAYNPGTGLPAQFDRHFFLCDFPGAVLMWTNIPDGASFKIGPVKNLFGDLGPTDVAFHPDGGVLVTDWFKSFEKSDKGRIYRIHDLATDLSATVQETKRLMAEGMEKRSVQELSGLLGHVDMRVRLEAQWALATMTNYAVLSRVAKNSKLAVLPRIHAIWALEQAIREIRMGPRQVNNVIYRSEMNALIPLLTDREPEIRAQACQLMASALCGDAQKSLRDLFRDPAPRVQAFAIRAYTRLSQMRPYVRATVTQSLITRAQEKFRDTVKGNWGVAGKSFDYPGEELRRVVENSQAGPYLLHEEVSLLIELVKLIPASAMTGYVKGDPNEAKNMRLAKLLALRRLANPAVAYFLEDADPQLVLEAARAINDLPIPEAMPALAGLLVVPPSGGLVAQQSKWPTLGPAKAGTTNANAKPETRPVLRSSGAPSANPGSLPTATAEGGNSELNFFTLRRALNANFRLGEATNAQALAIFAACSEAPEPLRIEALELLADWPKPPGRDHFMGLWRPLPPRDAAPAVGALRPFIPALLSDAAKEVRLATTRTTAALRMKEAEFFALVSDRKQFSEIRVEALKALAEQEDPRLPEALKLALADGSEPLRIEATRLQSVTGDASQFGRILENGSLAEKQGALAALASTKGETADALVAKQVEALLTETLSQELVLDVLEAASKRAWLKPKLAAYESSFPESDKLATHRPALHGGRAENGKRIFIENQQIACFRCHRINGDGGDVGPDLTGVGTKKSREQILESIVFPNKEVAAGFENVLLDLKDGASYVGLVKSETDTELVVNSPEDGIVTLKKSDVKSRQRGLSAMPEELATYLTRRELRDLIEFLASAK